MAKKQTPKTKAKPTPKPEKAASMLWTSFPTSLDPSAITAVFVLALKRRAFDKAKDGLTLSNVLGYVYGKFVVDSTPDEPPGPDGPPMAMQAPKTDADILALEAAFAGPPRGPDGTLLAIDFGRWISLFKLALDLWLSSTK